MSKSKTLIFEDGATQFRQRVIISILSHRSLLIRNIRSDDLLHPGLKDYEVNFLKLIDLMTNGSKLEINPTGTQVKFTPGFLVGGDIIHHCPDTRSIGYYLEGIVPLAPWGKESLSLTITGITDGYCDIDPSPDYFQLSILPLMERFGIGTDSDDGPPTIRIIQRAAAPSTENGNSGKVYFYCPIIKKEFQPFDFTDVGMVKRIRGTARSCKIISSSMTARVAYAAKGIFQRLLPDVWIHTDVHTPKKHSCGPSPGLSVVVSSESTTGVVLTAECCFDPTLERGTVLPEDLGQRGACLLLEEIRRGGCIDTSCQSLVLIWMCLTPEDVSRIRIGTLSMYTVETLRLLKRALDVEFKVVPDHDTKTVILSCLGTGYRNMAKAST